jgi:hypothetical protein
MNFFFSLFGIKQLPCLFKSVKPLLGGEVCRCLKKLLKGELILEKGVADLVSELDRASW